MFKNNYKFYLNNSKFFLRNKKNTFQDRFYVTLNCSANENATSTTHKEINNPIKWENALPYKKIPGPKKIPIFGVTHHFFPGGQYNKLSPPEIHRKLRDEFGNLVLVPPLPGRRDLVLSFNPDDVEYIFRTEGKWPLRRGMESFDYFRKHVRPDIFKETGGLLIEEGIKWQDARTKANPIMLPPKTARSYTTSVDEIGFDFIERIKSIRDENQEVPADFLNELNKFALEAIGFIAMNTRLGVLKDLDKNSDGQLFIQCVHDFFELMFYLDVIPSLWKIITTPKFVKMMKTLDMMTNLTMKQVDEAIKKIENEKSNDPDREISVFEKLYKIDRNVAIVMAIDMLMAGVDTTSGATASALYLLAKNPEKQEKLRKEIVSVLPNKNDPLTTATMSNLPYLKACIKETLRLKPVILANIRATGQDVVIQGYQIPKGTDVLMPTLINQEEKYFPRAKEFVPERWLRVNNDENIESARASHQFVYLPFGFGARSCIGKRFAELEIEIAVARIVRNFQVEWHYPELKYGNKLLNIPSDNLKLRFIDIEN